jgi:hypothetical protein
MEQFGVLIIFGLIALFQLLVKWLRGRTGLDEPPTTVPQPAPTYQPPAPDDEELIVRTPVRLPAPAVPEPVRLAMPPVAHARRRRLLGSRAELRRAIVLTEVLGPCRGMAERGASPTR